MKFIAFLLFLIFNPGIILALDYSAEETSLIERLEKSPWNELLNIAKSSEPQWVRAEAAFEAMRRDPDGPHANEPLALLEEQFDRFEERGKLHAAMALAWAGKVSPEIVETLARAADMEEAPHRARALVALSQVKEFGEPQLRYLYGKLYGAEVRNDLSLAAQIRPAFWEIFNESPQLPDFPFPSFDNEKSLTPVFVLGKLLDREETEQFAMDRLRSVVDREEPASDEAVAFAAEFILGHPDNIQYIDHVRQILEDEERRDDWGGLLQVLADFHDRSSAAETIIHQRCFDEDPNIAAKAKATLAAICPSNADYLNLALQMDGNFFSRHRKVIFTALLRENLPDVSFRKELENSFIESPDVTHPLLEGILLQSEYLEEFLPQVKEQFKRRSRTIHEVSLMAEILYVTEAPDALSLYLERLKTDHRWQVKRSMIDNLARLGGDEAFEAVLPYTRHRNPALRRSALIALKEMEL